VIFPGTTVNVSEGGMCVEWTPCEECRGYLPGEIHPDCIFAEYSFHREDSDTFYLSLFLSENDVINFAAKVVFVIKKEEDKEYIGVSFVDIDESTRNKIHDIIDKVTNNG
jgi:hypothetical protein